MRSNEGSTEVVLHDSVPRILPSAMFEVMQQKTLKLVGDNGNLPHVNLIVFITCKSVTLILLGIVNSSSTTLPLTLSCSASPISYVSNLNRHFPKPCWPSPIPSNSHSSHHKPNLAEYYVRVTKMKSRSIDCCHSRQTLQRW
jgi:hypothetical protein